MLKCTNDIKQQFLLSLSQTEHEQSSEQGGAPLKWPCPFILAAEMDFNEPLHVTLVLIAAAEIFERTLLGLVQLGSGTQKPMFFPVSGLFQ